MSNLLQSLDATIAGDAEAAGILRRAQERQAKAQEWADRNRAAAGGRTSDPAAMAEANADAEAEMTIAAAPVMSRAASVAAGIPFAGEWVDEFADKVNPGRGDQIREMQAAMSRVRPVQDIASRVGGGVAGSIPLAVGLNALPAISTGVTLGRTAVNALTGMFLGGAEGAVSGAGASPDDRWGGAVMNGLLGAGLGAGIGALSAPVGAAIGGIGRRLSGDNPVTVAAGALGVSRPAASRILESFKGDDLVRAQGQLRQAGPDGMLADAGVGARQLLDDAASAGGEPTSIVRRNVERSAAEAAPDIRRALDAALGRPVARREANKSIADRTRQVRERLYNRAYAQPVDYASPQGQAVEAALDRIPDSIAARAIQRANDHMRVNQVGAPQIKATINPDGTVTYQVMPNTVQLDYMKRALDQIVRDETDSVTGKVSALGVDASKLAGDLRTALGAAVPAYRAAVKVGGDKIAAENALDLGARAMSRAVTREDVERAMRGASIEEIDAFKTGLRGRIDEAMANVQRAITDNNMDARQALSVVKELSSEANRTKIRTVLGDVAARRLFTAIDRAANKLEVRSAVARNSATAIRTQGHAAMDAAIDGDIGRRAIQGDVAGATAQLYKTLVGRAPEQLTARKREIYAEVARALTEVKGPEARQALINIRKAMRGQPLVKAEADTVVGLLPYLPAASLYQLGQLGLDIAIPER